MPAAIYCKNIKGMSIQILGLVSFIATRPTFNIHIFSQTKLEDEMPIDVKQIGDDDFEVTASFDVVTYHKVKVSNVAYYKYTAGDISKAQLVTKAFLFLLRKEPNTSILADFRIEQIEQYFPEFKIIGTMDWLDVSV